MKLRKKKEIISRLKRWNELGLLRKRLLDVLYDVIECKRHARLGYDKFLCKDCDFKHKHICKMIRMIRYQSLLFSWNVDLLCDELEEVFK